MEFRCFNGTNNCDYCGSCHAEFKARTSDEKRRIYNKALDDFRKRINDFLNDSSDFADFVVTDSAIDCVIDELKK